ncbi:hypothetical protein HZA45_02965 [Candidatus Peregrinibacteria bacterium]|nr:hypothetical protein [Candidatus Peregrinibacteria bacterium]
MSSHTIGDAGMCPHCRMPMERSESADSSDIGKISVLYQCERCNYAAYSSEVKEHTAYKQPGDAFGYCLAAGILLLVIVGVVAHWQNITAWFR